MLDAWIIEELKRREELELENERPFLELPLPPEEYPKDDVEDNESKRGIVEIQL